MKWRKRCKVLAAAGIVVMAGFLVWQSTVLSRIREQTQVISLMEKENKKVQEQDDPDNKRIALTFDDGPHPVYTPKLLDGLKKRGVKATFFVVGKNAEENPEIIKRMSKEGHLIGNHTYDHVQISALSEKAASEQIVKTDDAIFRLTGRHTEFVRPPFGLWKDGLECGIQMFPVMWTIDPLDWTTGNTDSVVQKVVSKAKDDDIILLHDYYDSSVKAALRIVDILKTEGYEFVTVDELII